MKMKSVFSVLALMLFSPYVLAGGDFEGNGGDTCAGNFARMGRIVYDVISRSEYKNKIDMVRLDHAINTSSVSIVVGELRDPFGGVVPAANDGISKIFISKKGWCEISIYKQDAYLVLHEYLGIAMPGRDLQYQISGSLYSAVGVSNSNFLTYLWTGSDFDTQDIDFTSVTKVTANSVVVASGYTSREDGRYAVKGEVTCEAGRERIKLYQLKKTGNGSVESSVTQTYRFTSLQQCLRFVRKAAVIEHMVRMTIGLDSQTVIRF